MCVHVMRQFLVLIVPLFPKEKEYIYYIFQKERGFSPLTRALRVGYYALYG